MVRLHNSGSLLFASSLKLMDSIVAQVLQCFVPLSVSLIVHLSVFEPSKLPAIGQCGPIKTQNGHLSSSRLDGSVFHLPFAFLARLSFATVAWTRGVRKFPFVPPTF